ncbi:MAG: hypothetical protein R3F15_00345 [Lysobacterales bacterium]
MSVPVVYSPRYQRSGLVHFERFEWLHRQALAEGLVQVNEPQPLDLEDLRGFHADDYLDAMRTGARPLAQSSYLPWSEGLLDTCLAMLGGQLHAADLALGNGMAFNLACGFHHAFPERGGGFCVFNGLALVAAKRPELQVTVLDCDEHGGDGTEAFCARLDNLSAISIFGTRFGIRGGINSLAFNVPNEEGEARDPGFLDSLDQALDLILQQKPDLVLYQASADSHIEDPRATLKLSTATLRLRDQRVLSALRWARIPVLVTLAGGYQQPERTGALYLQTLRVANEVLSCRIPRVNPIHSGRRRPGTESD